MKTETLIHGDDYEIRKAYGLEGLQVQLRGDRIDELRKALNRALNTWEDAPEWLWKLSGVIE